MDGKTSSGSLSLRALEQQYKQELRQAIRTFRRWQNRRTETDVTQMILDREGEHIKHHITSLRELYREARSWRASAPLSE